LNLYFKGHRKHTAGRIFSLYGGIRLHNLGGMKQMDALIDVTQAGALTYSMKSAFDPLLN
jgi:hypothetical protein